MKTIASAILVIAIGVPALAEDQKLNLPFTWSASDLAVLDSGPTQKTGIGRSELVMAGTGGTPFDNLVGTCLVISHFVPDTPDYDAAGNCVLVNEDGDRIFEEFKEVNGKGSGKFINGTGALAGITADYTYENTWHGSPAADRNAGVGLKTGTWRKAGS